MNRISHVSHQLRSLPITDRTTAQLLRQRWPPHQIHHNRRLITTQDFQNSHNSRMPQSAQGLRLIHQTLNIRHCRAGMPQHLDSNRSIQQHIQYFPHLSRGTAAKTTDGRKTLQNRQIADSVQLVIRRTQRPLMRRRNLRRPHRNERTVPSGIRRLANHRQPQRLSTGIHQAHHQATTAIAVLNMLLKYTRTGVVQSPIKILPQNRVIDAFVRGCATAGHVSVPAEFSTMPENTNPLQPRGNRGGARSLLAYKRRKSVDIIRCTRARAEYTAPTLRFSTAPTASADCP